MDDFFMITCITLLAAIAVISAGHALITKRDPRSALGWITISLTIPLFGALFYWSMGVNRLRRKAREWQETGRRLGSEPFPIRAEPVALSIPQEACHLSDLRALTDRVVSTPLLMGNLIKPLQDGEEAYAAMIAGIESAEHSINLSTYIFDSDHVGREFVAALCQAAERGVEVRVIIDGLGEKYSFPPVHVLFKGSGVKVRRFLPLRHGIYINLRNHRKLVIIDGKKAFTGGMNIGGRHLVKREAPPPVVRDIHFSVAGPVVNDLQRVFLEDWHFVSRELVTDSRFFPHLEAAGNMTARAISDGPDKEFSKLHWVVMGALSCSRRSVSIMTPYFIPDRPLISALIMSALRGINVTLILPGRNNLPYVHWATTAYLWELLQHNIRVFYQPPPFVHTKMLLVDGVWSLIGSANLDPRSLRLNFELDLEVYDVPFNQVLQDQFTTTLEVSREVTLSEVDCRSLPVKLRDSTAKLFSPYL